MSSRRVTCALLAALVMLGASGAPAAGEETNPPATQGVDPEVGAPAGVILAPADADEAGRRQAEEALRATQSELRRALVDHKRQSRRLVPVRRRQAQLQDEVARRQEQDRVAGEELAAARDRVRDLAVAGYVIGGDVPPVDYLLRSKNPSDLVRRHSLVRTATEARADALELYQAAKRRASDQLLDGLLELDRVNAEAARVENEIGLAQRRVDELRADADNQRQLLDVITAAAPMGSSDIPRLFLDAYRKAAVAMAKRVPHCRVPWAAVAAIGKIESNHGRYRGARLALNGDVHPRILGIPLDGTRGTRLIRDTDGGALDLDTVHDRAVGPMQFIPSTWARMAQDGNGDGTKDPNNAYDATLAAAAYLCRAVPMGGLDDEERIRRAFFSYNRSSSYVDLVHAWMTHFQGLGL